MKEKRWNHKRQQHFPFFFKTKKAKYFLLTEAALWLLFLFSENCLALMLFCGIICVHLFSSRREAINTDYGITIFKYSYYKVPINDINKIIINVILLWEKFFIKHPSYRINIHDLISHISVHIINDSTCVPKNDKLTIYINEEGIELHLKRILHEIIASIVFKNLEMNIANNILKRHKLC